MIAVNSKIVSRSILRAVDPLEMAWVAKKPANESLTGLFIGPLTTQFNLFLLLGR